MAEAPNTKPASTIHNQTAATAGSVDQAPQQQHHAAPEQAPPMTDLPPASTFPREHPPREPMSMQPKIGQYNDSPPDRKPPHFPNYPTATDSFPHTPYTGMSAPSVPRPHTGTSADRIPHLTSYPTAPGSASQASQTPPSSQQGVSAAGWLVPPPANLTSKITFEGTFDNFSAIIPVSCSFILLLKRQFLVSWKREWFENTRKEKEPRS